MHNIALLFGAVDLVFAIYHFYRQEVELQKRPAELYYERQDKNDRSSYLGVVQRTRMAREKTC